MAKPMTAQQLMDFAKVTAMRVQHAYDVWRDRWEPGSTSAPRDYMKLSMQEAEIAAGMYGEGMRRAAELAEQNGYVLAANVIRKEIGDA